MPRILLHELDAQSEPVFLLETLEKNGKIKKVGYEKHGNGFVVFDGEKTLISRVDLTACNADTMLALVRRFADALSRVPTYIVYE